MATTRIGRPPVDDPRSESVYIRLTRAEAQLVDEAKERLAPGAGLSRAAFMRWLLDGYLNGRLVPVERGGATRRRPGKR